MKRDVRGSRSITLTQPSPSFYVPWLNKVHELKSVLEAGGKANRRRLLTAGLPLVISTITFSEVDRRSDSMRSPFHQAIRKHEMEVSFDHRALLKNFLFQEGVTILVL